MAGYRRKIFTVVAVLGLALLVPACKKPVAPPAAPATTTAPASQAGSTATSSSSTASQSSATEVTAPANGTAERKALLDAARTHFSTTSEFYVHQLYVQGSTAIGEISQVTGGDGKRTFVAWGDGPNWAVVWTAPAGSSKATSTSAANALPTFSAKLLDKITWKSSGPTAAEIAAKQATLATAAKTWSKSTMKGSGQPYKITVNKVAIDANGVWWGHVVTQPTTDARSAYEPLNFWAKYSSGAWKGSLQDPEPPPASSYFPASVIPKLAL